MAVDTRTRTNSRDAAREEERGERELAVGAGGQVAARRLVLRRCGVRQVGGAGESWGLDVQRQSTRRSRNREAR